VEVLPLVDLTRQVLNSLLLGSKQDNPTIVGKESTFKTKSTIVSSQVRTLEAKESSDSNAREKVEAKVFRYNRTSYLYFAE
jgi:hypothetical protein